jgi:hypothetical protein
MLQSADSDFLRALVDLGKNFVKGNIPIRSERLYRRLYKQKRRFRCLASCTKRSPAFTRKKFNQKGGFLPLLPLLGTLVPLAGQVLSGILDD